MKRLLALLVALILFALPAFGEPRGPFDYTDDILEDGSLIYYFMDLSLRLPADWHGKVMAMQKNDSVCFYQIASHDKYLEENLEDGGFLFRLGASADASFTTLPAFKFLGYSDRSLMNYYLELPSDYPAYNEEDIRAEYDAMYGQIDFVVENAEFYPPVDGGEAEAGETAGDAAEAENAAAAAAEVSWTPAQVRYQFEHRMMPKYFYDNPANMLDVLGSAGLYRLWEAVSTDNGVDPTYPAEDYVQHFYKTADGATLLQIELPQPDANTLCYRIYLVYDPASGSAGYYTVESDDFTPDAAFICMWTDDGTHKNFGAMNVIEKGDGYETAILDEAAIIAELAGISKELTPVDAPAGT